MIDTILIDDNNEDLEKLNQDLSEIEYIRVLAKFNSPIKAMEFVVNNKVDLIISDIDMPQLNGIETIKNISNPPKVIFISSYPEYAIESFDVKPLHYLLKPYKKEQLLKATYRALESITTKTIHPDNFIYVLIDKNYHKITHEEILYIKAEQNYVKIFTQIKSYLVLSNLSLFLSELPKPQFIRVHKSYAVNTYNISNYNTNEIMIGETTIPISEAYKEETLNFLGKNTFKRNK